MNEEKKVFKRTSVLAATLALAIISIAVVKTTGQDGAKLRDKVAAERWEYLAVAGPSAANLTETGNPNMRKEPAVPFAREAFVLEQHLDKLGRNGWELVSVAGSPNDPAFYFKRRK